MTSRTKQTSCPHQCLGRPLPGDILISFGLLGLSLSTLSLGITSNEQHVPTLITTGAFGTTTSLGTVLANFAMGLAGGFLAGHAKEGGHLNGTASGGVAGLVAIAAGADIYHPLQTFLIAAGLATVGLWWRERLALRYGVDDVTGTVALHGIVGFLGVALSGIILWTYPASPEMDFARINPFGQIVGAIFAFGLFGFLPGYLISRFLRFLDLLQQPALFPARWRGPCRIRLRASASNAKPWIVKYPPQNLLNPTATDDAERCIDVSDLLPLARNQGSLDRSNYCLLYLVADRQNSN